MTRTALVILAKLICMKELREGLRDRRSIAASLVATLAGPVLAGVVLMMLASEADAGRLSAGAIGERAVGVLPVFLLVSVFVMGMGLAIDTTAGERERRSLEPLLLSGVPSTAIGIGKWAAIAVMNVCGLVLTLLCAVAILVGLSGGALGLLDMASVSLPVLMAGVPLALLASALQVAAATHARTFKEGQTYLSMLLFLPMAIGMLSAFARPQPAPWRMAVPLFAQHQLIAGALRGEAAGVLALVLPALVALTATALLVRWTASLLTNDRILYG